jgi:hypothetical protein
LDAKVLKIKGFDSLFIGWEKPKTTSVWNASNWNAAQHDSFEGFKRIVIVAIFFLPGISFCCAQHKYIDTISITPLHTAALEATQLVYLVALIAAYATSACTYVA